MAQRVKDLVLTCCGSGYSCGIGLPPAQEFPHAVGTAKKKKKIFKVPVVYLQEVTAGPFIIQLESPK